MFSEALHSAAADYLWLLDRGYPTTGSIKLVGDRHRLTRAERQMLFRGVDATNAAESRRRRIVGRDAVRGATLGVDGHNVLLTIANYLRGVPVFEANDGLVRDVGSVHGRVHDDELMERSISILGATIAQLQPESVEACFDEPVSHSRDHARRLESLLVRSGVDARFYLAPSADGTLRALKIELLASSDSALVDSVSVPVFDLGRECLRGNYIQEFPSFRTVPSSA